MTNVTLTLSDRTAKAALEAIKGRAAQYPDSKDWDAVLREFRRAIRDTQSPPYGTDADETGDKETTA